jgi:hypothetical protein
METQTKVALIGAIGTIIAAIIASPYLLQKMDNANPDIDSSSESNPSIPSEPIGSESAVTKSITASANDYPRTVSPGGSSQISVLALADNQRLPDANVTINAGGGYFEDTGATTTTGRTDSSGTFRTIWHTYEPSAYSGDMSYVLDIKIEKLGYVMGQTDLEIFIKNS